jgi:hypothetical protein
MSKVTIAPATIFIAGGSSTAGAQAQVTGINFGSAAISGAAAGYSSATRPVEVTATISFSPSNVMFTGLGTQNLTLILSAPAPASGLSISLSSANTGVATVPSNVNFTPNATSVSVPITCRAAGSAIITATPAVPNVGSTLANVTITTGADITLASGVTVAPGESEVMTVALTSPSAGGVFLTLSSSDTSKVTISPASLYIPAGASTPLTQPRVTGVNFGTANISASAFGLVGNTQTVRVAATLFGPASVSLNRGTTQNLTFTLSAPSPTPLTVALVSDNPSVAGLPPSVTIPAHGTSAIVPLTGIAAGSTVIRAGAPPNIAEKAVSVTVLAPASITLPNVTATLGSSVPFPIALGTPAPPSGVTVALTSSNRLTLTVSPSSVFIPAGLTTPATQPQVTGVNIGAAIVTASAPGYLSASQTVAVPATISFSPSALIIPGPGATAKLLLALSVSAPWGPESAPWSNGLTIQLSSSNPNVARVPPSIDLYPDGSEFTTVVILVTGVSPGTAIIRAGAPPFIPEITASVTVTP